VAHVDDCACGRVLSCVLNQLVGNLGLVGDVLAADLVFAQAKSAALFSASGAISPADRADTVGTMVTRRVAESSALDLILVADQRGASATAVSALGA